MAFTSCLKRKGPDQGPSSAASIDSATDQVYFLIVMN
jgi:hypothetical protein